jgi:hypothetical protein
MPDFGLRTDGTKKGNGWLGVLNRPDGKVSTEISAGFNIDGNEVDIPLLVPTLDPEEINYLLSVPPGELDMRHPLMKPIRMKAYQHAIGRMRQKLSPFKDEQ